MDFDYRPLLALVGLGLIGYVAWDGWRKRARNSYKFKLERNLPPEMPVRADREGFNQDGVGRPRVRGLSDTTMVNPDSFSRHDVAKEAFAKKGRPSDHLEPTFDESGELGTDDEQSDSHAIFSRGVTPDLFGDHAESPRQRPAKRAETSVERASTRRAEPDVIALMVLALDGQLFRGATLVPCMLEHDLRFGDMDIFHRHADASGQGPVLFSVANALKPGTFDPQQMDNFSSPGISLFMQLPGPQDPRMAYNIMLSTAEQIAHAIGGEVRDASRKALSTEVRLRHQEMLADHERKLFAGG